MLRNIFTLVLIICISFFAGKYKARQEIQEEVTRIETKMQEASVEANEKLKKEKQDAQNKINAIKSSINDGSLRLSIRTSGSASSTCGNTEERAELNREDAQDLVSITADGDQAIRELNSCIDFYNNLRNIK